MEALVRTRGTAKGKLTIFKNYIVSTVEAQAEHGRPLDEVTALEIRERISRIRETYNKFEQIQAEIEAICGEEKAQEAGEYREQFETEYYQTIARAEFLLIRQALDANTRVASGSQAQEQLLQGAQVLPNPARQPNQHIILKTAGIRLPTIELPKFSGNFSDWLSFRDTFESLIHRNETIDPIQKFHYLKASLEGSAAQIIKSLEISAVNYAVAWSAICDRYNNKRLLAHNHVKAIFSISQMKQESASQIRETIDTLNKHLRALTALEQSTEQWDTLLIYIISTKLDGVTAREWEKERAGNDIPTLEEFKTFLISRADLLDSIEINEKDVSKSKQADRPKVKSFLVQKQRCSLCKEAHHLANCEQFLKLTPQRRAEQLKGSKLCLNCMKPGHFIKDCRASLCKKCSGKHNTLLHFEKQSSENATPVVESGSSSVLCSHSQQASGVLLATALVLVTDRRGKQRSVRALLDPGSQSSLITRKLCQELSLDTNRINTSIEAINGMALQIEHSCEVKIAAHYNNYEFRVKCLVTPEITSQLPSRRINFQSLQIPSNIKLADPSFYTPGGIDILIGGDWFWNLLCIGQFKIEQLTMQKTRLGWIAAGPLEPTSVNPIKCNFAKEVDIDRQLTKFWNIEEIQDQRIFTSEEREAEAHFVRTTRRNEDGRFIVSMPFKKGPDELGESRAIARRRLINLEKKLHRTEALEQQYSAFLEEYERLGHMRKISNEATQGPVYYLPHHSVIRMESLRTKVRVVFDASAATDSGTSLNDLQMIGPTIQEELLAILLRFRTHTYTVSADIEKMYRQVLISPEQRPLQRILWRVKGEELISTFELNTLTYGTASASFLATRCLMELANEFADQAPKIARIIRKDFYMDDLLTGTNSIDEAKEIIQGLSHILGTAGFKLRKWLSNEPSITANIPTKDKLPEDVEFTDGKQTKTLGTYWRAQSDDITFKVKENMQTKITKRHILAEIAKIFDPLGILGPCNIIAKILMQKLWLYKLSWDESLPAELHEKWSAFRKQMQEINKIKIPRSVVGKDCTSLQLHAFSDASLNAYGACVYIRSQDPEGNYQVSLLCAKSRVAPL